MAKYKAYPEYKDSEIEWLGKIPSGWLLKKAKYIFQRVQRPLRDIDGVVTAFRDGQVTLRTNRRTDGFTNSVKEIGYQGVRRNDLVIHAMDGFAGAIGVSDSDGKCSPVCSVCIPWKNQSVNMHFYGYLVRQLAVTDFILSLAKGIRERSTEFRFSEFSGLMLAIPPIYEQNQIATFLDHETAKIDNLIEKQQQLIELLKEKRQAVISHAVTKGLNPDVPMKDSGVEWLGDVPEHWTIKPLRYLGDCQNGINIGAEAFGSGFPFVSYGDAYKNRVLPDNGSGLVQSTTEDRRKYSLLRGDVLFTRTSETIEEIGFASACIKSIENACFAGFLIRFRPKSSDLCIEYSKYYFSNQLLRIFFTKEMNLITRASLSQDLLKTMPVVIPPVDEQIKIAELLDNISEKFDQLQLLGEEQIKYLQERRTALISAAVTGKIDVRDWIAPDTQDVEEPQEATA
ncbi:MAG: restriction endonuclease subunit S [Hafnia sp.]